MSRNDKAIAAPERRSRTAGNALSIEAIASLYEDLASGVDRIGAGAPQEGKFLSGAYANHAGRRDYKLYIPGAFRGQALPLIVMLHGCSQDPDDFAVGTRMNAIADENNCFVLYPAQSDAANGSRCWNWFDALNQKRNLGEPSIIAGMTRDIIKTCHIDSRKVFIAGLSSGGAMAAIMGTTYPELYAAVGIHSGMPYASARNFSSAITAMKNGNGTSGSGGNARFVFLPKRKAMPIIVFHGDRDTTVHPDNGDQIIAQSISIAAHNSALPESEFFPYITVGQGKVENGRTYTHAVHRDNDGRIIAEHWIVHGSGHAWSGGSSRGSFTDSRGPDAGREMLRFFLTHA